MQWVVVLVVGVLVLALVLGVGLVSRLSARQKVLDGARPVLTPGRLATDTAGINFISANVDMANSIVTAQGGAAAEVPTIVAYVVKANHVSPAPGPRAPAPELPAHHGAAAGDPAVGRDG